VRTYVALAGAGFRRYSTYRQATAAGAFTNIVWGFMRCYVLLSLADAHGMTGGYDRAQLATFVWAGQGMLAVVNFWGPLDLAERIRSGDVVSDLLRPVHPVASYLAADLGRAGHAALTRFIAPMIAGFLFFDLHLPTNPLSYLLFVVSMLLATVVGFAGRCLIGMSGYWLLDVRGLQIVWMFFSGAGGGLYFPLPLLPDAAATVLWLATPFPYLMQVPLDVLAERGGLAHALPAMGGQLVWIAVLLVACVRLQRSAERKLVVQGG
jgi:ABC-2 type transport system permease protein